MAKKREQGIEGLAVAKPGQCSGDRKRKLRILKRGDQRRRRLSIADAAECDCGRLARVEIFSPELLDQQIDDAGAVAHQRLDDLRANRALPEQAGQGPLHRRAVLPPHDARNPSQPIPGPTR